MRFGLSDSSHDWSVYSALQTLVLQRCDVPWHRLPFGVALTTLSLVQEVDIQANRPTLAIFVETLEKLKQLRTLHLSYYLPTTDEFATLSATSSRSSPALLELDALTVRDSMQQISGVFKLVKFKSVGRARIFITDAMICTVRLQELLSTFKASWTLAARLFSQMHTTPRHLRIIDPEPDEEACDMQYPALLLGFNYDKMDASGLRERDLSILFHRNATFPLSNVLSTVARSLDLSQLESLEFRYRHCIYDHPILPSSITDNEWKATLLLLQSPRIVEDLGDGTVLGIILGLLCDHKLIQGAHPNQAAPFSKLEQLQCGGVDEEHGPIRWCDDPEIVLKAIRSTLKAKPSRLPRVELALGSYWENIAEILNYNFDLMTTFLKMWTPR